MHFLHLQSLNLHTRENYFFDKYNKCLPFLHMYGSLLLKHSYFLSASGDPSETRKGELQKNKNWNLSSGYLHSHKKHPSSLRNIKVKEQAALRSWRSIVVSFKNNRITLFSINKWLATNEASVSFCLCLMEQNTA